MKRALACALALAGCTSFEDPDVVVDLRVLAISADLPEQIVDVDLQHPQQPAELLQQLVPTEVCALVADPGKDRGLHYEISICPYTRNGRCDSAATAVVGSGEIADPDTGVQQPPMCATIAPNANLLGVLLEVLNDDALAGLGGIDYLAELRVGGVGGDPDLDLYAAKTLRVAPRIPAERMANHNPTIDGIMIDDATPLPLGRCPAQAAPLEVAPGTKLRFTPLETAGAREDYVVPTLSGASRMFTESLTYQWISGAGSFSAGSTGGPRDVAGNPAPLFTDWTAPKAKDVSGPTDVPLWIIQRDERLGVTWYESCVRVVP